MRWTACTGAAFIEKIGVPVSVEQVGMWGVGIAGDKGSGRRPALTEIFGILSRIYDI